MGVSALAALRRTESVTGVSQSTVPLLMQEQRPYDTALLVRGGGSLDTVKDPPVQAFSLVSGSKTACWMILIISIVAEGLATSLSKSARDTGNYARLLAAIGVYVPW
jgi:hypothetical protein